MKVWSIINNKEIGNTAIVNNIIYLIICIIIIFIICTLYKTINNDDNDIYSSNKKTIHKIIKWKIKKYDKITDIE